jgi:hypothetical protein
MKTDKYKFNHGHNPSRLITGHWAFKIIGADDETTVFKYGRLDAAAAKAAQELGVSKNELEVLP